MKQQKLIKEIPNFWRPEFIPFYPEKKSQYGLNDKETIIYGFVRHFLRNCAGKFFFTNEQLRYVLVGVKRDGTITEIVRDLCKKCPDIKTRLEIRKNGGTVRVIEWVGDKADLRKTVSPTYGKPLAIENKVKNTTTNDIDLKKLFDETITIPQNENTILLREEREKFLEYWTEKSVGGKKERWQMERVFDVKRRWRTWLRFVEARLRPKEFKKDVDYRPRIGGMAPIER